MQFLGADSYLGSQAKLPSISETGAGVDLDAGGIHFIKEAHGGIIVLSDNSLICS